MQQTGKQQLERTAWWGIQNIDLEKLYLSESVEKSDISEYRVL